MTEYLDPIPNTLPAISDREFDAMVRARWVHTPEWTLRQGKKPHPGYSHINKYCVTCEGKGEFLGLKGGSTAHYLCPCLDQWTLDSLFAAAEISRKFRGLGVEDGTGLPAASLDVLSEWIEDTGRDQGQIIVGDTNSGKTFLASLIMRAYFVEGKTSFMTRTDTMRADAIQGFDDPDAKERYDRKVRNVDLLVVDEMQNVELAAKVEFLVSNFADILRYRQTHGRPTLLISTKDSDWLMQKYYDAAGVISEMESHKISRGSFAADRDARNARETQLGVKRPRTLG